MFARQGCDSASGVRGSASAAVAKLQRARDTLIRLLIRGMDEHATHRRRGPQQQGQGRGNRLGPAVRVLVPPSGLHPDMGRPGSRSRRASTAGRLDHRHHLLRRLQRAVLSHRAAGAGVRGRPQRGASVAASAQARGASCSLQLRRILAVLRRGRLGRQLRRSIAIGCGRCWTPDTRAYWDRLNIIGRPRHAYFTDGFYRHGMLGRFIGLAHRAGETGADRSCRAAERQGRILPNASGRWIACIGCFIRRWRA